MGGGSAKKAVTSIATGGISNTATAIKNKDPKGVLTSMVTAAAAPTIAPVVAPVAKATGKDVNKVVEKASVGGLVGPAKELGDKSIDKVTPMKQGVVAVAPDAATGMASSNSNDAPRTRRGKPRTQTIYGGALSGIANSTRSKILGA
jgi:hypothetical protein